MDINIKIVATISPTWTWSNKFQLFHDCIRQNLLFFFNTVIQVTSTPLLIEEFIGIFFCKELVCEQKTLPILSKTIPLIVMNVIGVYYKLRRPSHWVNLPEPVLPVAGVDSPCGGVLALPLHSESPGLPASCRGPGSPPCRGEVLLQQTTLEEHTF